MVTVTKKKVKNFFHKQQFFQTTYDLEITDSTYVFLTLGQSNAANRSTDVYQPKREVYNYYNNKIYKAKEPLIGTVGDKTSVWTRVSDSLVALKKCDKVVLIPIAIGNTTVEDWSNGFCSEILQNTLEELKINNIKPTHVLWHQGEANNGKSKNYKSELVKVLNNIRKFTNAPFYCSIATYNPESTLTLGIDVELQNIQTAFIKENDDVFLGANTDELIHAIYRYDGQHFSSIGNKKYAEMWINALTQ